MSRKLGFVGIGLLIVLVGLIPLAVFAAERTIGVGAQGLSSPVPSRMANEWRRVGEANGWGILTVDGGGDMQKVIDAALTWVQMEVDAIHIFFPPAGSIGELAEACEAAGIPLITTGYGCGQGQTFDVGMSDFEGGVKMTQWLFDTLGREGEIAVLHWDQVPCPRQRYAMLEAMLPEYPNISVVASHVAKFPGAGEDCRAAMENILLAHPEIDGVWGAWDELTMGAVQAVIAEGRDDIVCVGIDGNLSTFDAIRSGGPFKMTIAPDWEQGVTLAVTELQERLWQGLPPAQQQFYIDIPIVTAYNCPPAGWYYSEWIAAGMPDEPK
ncbi:sugar ABC transporter substrate-binding protein [Candidatus Bipolaricaulota bacterium]|nr:sugar ABC transporter substrate-binding protein [Candidatus Bipolaricaulota bacterium]